MEKTMEDLPKDSKKQNGEHSVEKNREHSAGQNGISTMESYCKECTCMIAEDSCIVCKTTEFSCEGTCHCCLMYREYKNRDLKHKSSIGELPNIRPECMTMDHLTNNDEEFEEIEPINESISCNELFCEECTCVFDKPPCIVCEKTDFQCDGSCSCCKDYRVVKKMEGLHCSKLEELTNSTSSVNEPLAEVISVQEKILPYDVTMQSTESSVPSSAEAQSAPDSFEELTAIKKARELTELRELVRTGLTAESPPSHLIDLSFALSELNAAVAVTAINVLENDLESPSIGQDLTIVTGNLIVIGSPATDKELCVDVVPEQSKEKDSQPMDVLCAENIDYLLSTSIEVPIGCESCKCITCENADFPCEICTSNEYTCGGICLCCSKFRVNEIRRSFRKRRSGVKPSP